jgi:hypothetical protein
MNNQASAPRSKQLWTYIVLLVVVLGLAGASLWALRTSNSDSTSEDTSKVAPASDSTAEEGEKGTLVPAPTTDEDKAAPPAEGDSEARPAPGSR